MNSGQNTYSSRRKFLGYSLKLTGVSTLLIPLHKALGALDVANRKLYKFFALDRLVLNTKTKVVHLPTGKIFSKYPTIKRQSIISPANWEVTVKAPYHFNKEKSGIILETLALTRLGAGINDRALTDAYRILSIAFTGTYESKEGIMLNKFNFRIHHLLLQVISLNNTIPAAQKWEKFRSATGAIDYSLKDKRPLPKFMSWVKSKTGFERKVSYILQNRQTYISRLAKRASRFK